MKMKKFSFNLLKSVTLLALISLSTIRCGGGDPPTPKKEDKDKNKEKDNENDNSNGNNNLNNNTNNTGDNNGEDPLNNLNNEEDEEENNTDNESGSNGNESNQDTDPIPTDLSEFVSKLQDLKISIDIKDAKTKKEVVKAIENKINKANMFTLSNMKDISNKLTNETLKKELNEKINNKISTNSVELKKDSLEYIVERLPSREKVFQGAKPTGPSIEKKLKGSLSGHRTSNYKTYLNVYYRTYMTLNHLFELPPKDRKDIVKSLEISRATFNLHLLMKDRNNKKNEYTSPDKIFQYKSGIMGWGSQMLYPLTTKEFLAKLKRKENKFATQEEKDYAKVLSNKIQNSKKYFTEQGDIKNLEAAITHLNKFITN